MALLGQPDATLHEVLRIFSDKEFRRSVGKSLRNETPYLPIARVRPVLVRLPHRWHGADPKQSRGIPRRSPAQSHIDCTGERPADPADHGQGAGALGQPGERQDRRGQLFASRSIARYRDRACRVQPRGHARRKNFFVYIDEFQSFTDAGNGRHALSSTLADLGSVGEGIFHALPDMARNFDTVSARP